MEVRIPDPATERATSSEIEVLDLENFRLLLRHGRPSQQLLSSCYLTGVTAWYRSGRPNIKQRLAILERDLTGRVLFLTTITLNQQ